MLVALGSRFVPWPIAANTALLALGVLLLPLFLEIHRAVTAEERVTFFRSFNDASPEIAKSISDYVARSRTTSIRCLGVALYYQWPFLEELLSRLMQEGRRQVTVELAMLDPTWKDMDHFNDAWSAQAQGSYRRIQSFLEQHSETLKTLQWEMTVYRYRFLPPCFGILLGGDTLFLGTVFWDRGRLKAGQNAIEVFTASAVPRGNAKIQEFVDWFAFCKVPHLRLSVRTADTTPAPPPTPSLPS